MSHDIFISYRRVDQELAKALVEELTAQGVRVWWDGEIEGGEDWREAIAENLSLSQALVILFSEACNDSKQLKKEIALADTLDKVIVPVLIEDTKPRGHFLYEMAAINWLQIHPNPETKIEGLVTRLISELDLQAEAGAPALNIEPVLSGDEPAAPPQPPKSDALERKVQAKEASKQEKRKRRDFLPFKWYEVVVFALIVGGALLNAEFEEYSMVSTLVGVTLFVILYSLIILPIRYYFRRLPAKAAAFWLFTNLSIFGIPLGVLYSLDVGEPILLGITTMVIVCLIYSIFAVAIYGILRFQYALRNFRKNVQVVD